jgi:hypothetical protein
MTQMSSHTEVLVRCSRSAVGLYEEHAWFDSRADYQLSWLWRFFLIFTLVYWARCRYSTSGHDRLQIVLSSFMRYSYRYRLFVQHFKITHKNLPQFLFLSRFFQVMILLISLILMLLTILIPFFQLSNLSLTLMMWSTTWNVRFIP